jgi:23S rRNA (cytidine1920-2'-O)/16S rRNA (cytidine1409-2'-O)-methyltransferase
VAPRRRLDVELVRRGRVASRAEAQELIADHRVLVGGAMADKASRLVAPGDAIELVEDRPTFVGRGGRKLEHALDHFGIDVAGRRALDAGASTGGFTDCLLQRGAAHVVALDVGHGQLHERIRADPRVTVLERTNVRTVDEAVIGGPVELVVADLSFISLTLVADALVGVCQPGAEMVLLVKPQFEAGRAEVSRGRGVITDPATRQRAVDDVAAAYRTRGCEVLGATESPITGADGNVEFLLHLRVPAGVAGMPAPEGAR